MNDEIAEIVEEIADTEEFFSDIIRTIAERFGIEERDAEELWEEWLKEYVFG